MRYMTAPLAIPNSHQTKPAEERSFDHLCIFVAVFGTSFNPILCYVQSNAFKKNAFKIVRNMNYTMFIIILFCICIQTQLQQTICFTCWTKLNLKVKLRYKRNKFNKFTASSWKTVAIINDLVMKLAVIPFLGQDAACSFLARSTSLAFCTKKLRSLASVALSWGQTNAQLDMINSQLDYNDRHR